MMQTVIADFFSTPRASTLSSKLMQELDPKAKTTSRKRKLKSIENSSGSGGTPKLHQTIIDAGQRNIGLQHCIQCGMVYSQENPNDVKQHERYHNRFTEVRNFRVTLSQLDAWKSQLQHEQVTLPMKGLLFVLGSSSTATLKRKCEHILTNFVNEELGYSPELPVWDRDAKRRAFVFVVEQPMVGKAPFIAGLLLVDPVQEVILMPSQRPYKGTFLGVDRIWVHSHVRRQGVARFLLDSARRLLTPAGQPEFKPNRVAFSDPSELGIKLAVSYVGDKQGGRYLIYSPEIPHRDPAEALIRKMSDDSNNNGNGSGEGGGSNDGGK